MSDARFSIDYGKRNAKCQMSKCKQTIEKGSMRIAKIVKSPFSDDGDMKQFHHPHCLFDAFKRARATTKVIDDPSDIEGWKEVKDEDKSIIIDLISELEKFRSANNSSAKTSKKTPTKKAAPKAEPEAEDGPIEIAEFSLSGKGHKDDSFREFRRLVAVVAEEPGHNATTEIFKKFFNKGSDGTKFQGDLLIWVRLLLPGTIKRVYNLQSRQLVKIFSRIFATNEKEMLTHLEQGDVADTVATFFDKSSSKVQPSKSSKLTLKDVDQFLDKLTALTREGDQVSALGGFAAHCTSNDLKMLIRLIKGDLRMGSGAKPVLESLHKEAYEAFNASRNIEGVIAQILEHRKQGKVGSLEVGATLMQPIQPMLAAPCKSVEMAFAKCKNGIFSEIKYDGERLQLHKKGDKIAYYSRSLKPVMPHKVKHFKDHLSSAFPDGDDLILDAEVLMIDNKTGIPLPFGTLGVHKAAGYADAQPCLFIFDCIYYNGKSYMNKPIVERRKLLESHMTEVGNSIKFSELKVIKSHSELRNMINTVIAQGLEGLVLKDKLSTYDPGKRHWLKVKKDYLDDGAMADTADLVVLGAWYGSGNRGGIMSIFLMGCYNQETRQWCTVTKVHSGFDDATLDRHQKDLGPKMVKIKGDYSKVPNWLDCTRQMVPDFVVKDPKDSPVWEVTGAEFTKAEIHTADGISIRFPRVTKIRQDKDWKTATSLSQLKDLYKASKEVSDVKPMSEDLSPKKRKAEDDSDATPEKKPKLKAPMKSTDEELSPKKKPKIEFEKSPEKNSAKSSPSPLKMSRRKEGRSYDKRYIKTEHGFTLKVVSESKEKNMVKFVCNPDCEVGDLVSSGSVYELALRRKLAEDATYEALRKCFVTLRNQLKSEGVKKEVNIKMDVDGNAMLKGLNINAVRTLVKNVFYKDSDISITLVVPNLGPPPSSENGSSIDTKSENRESKGSLKSAKSGYPFLKVFEDQKLTPIKNSFRKK